jgi:putative ABC transport system substrate-binding protein
MRPKETIMRYRAVAGIMTLALSLLVAPLASAAQPSMKVHRVGRITAAHPPAGSDPLLEAFRQGLRELGHVEGQNLALEVR